jgi:hypothetical protein
MGRVKFSDDSASWHNLSPGVGGSSSIAAAYVSGTHGIIYSLEGSNDNLHEITLIPAVGTT